MKPPETEKGFQQAVVDLATRLGWKVHWTHDSRHSPKGWPDLVLVLAAPPGPDRPPGRLVFAECKRQSGNLTPEQAEWLDALAACGCEVFIWRPSDWQEIALVLRNLR